MQNNVRGFVYKLKPKFPKHSSARRHRKNKRRILLRKKAILMIIAELMILILLGYFLTSVQTDVSRRLQSLNSTAKLDKIRDTIDLNTIKSERLRTNYDDLYIAKAKSAALFFSKETHYTRTTLQEFARRMNAANMIITDRKGNRLCSAFHTEADLRKARFNQLKTVFTKGTMDPFSVRHCADDPEYRYYSARINDNRMVVVVMDMNQRNELINGISSMSETLSNVSEGLNGFAFAVNSLDHTFIFYPERSMIGKSVLSNGLSIDTLQDNFEGILNIRGTNYFCTGKKIGINYIYCAVPTREMYSSTTSTVIIMLLAFFVITSLLAAFSGLTLNEIISENERSQDPKHGKELAKMIRSKVNTRLLPVSAVCILLVLLLTFYLQTLFCLSQQSVSNRVHLKEVRDRLVENATVTETASKYFKQEYMIKCRTAEYILSHVHGEITWEFMQDLCSALDVRSVWLLDSTGRTIATNEAMWDFALSTNPEDQSYPFRAIIDGTTLEIIQEPYESDDAGRSLIQYIGCAVQDKKHHTTGLVQIAINPEQITDSVDLTDVTIALHDISFGRNSFTFAVDKETGNFIYFQDLDLIDKSALEYGMKEYQLRGDLSDQITINRKSYFCASMEIGGAYVYIATPLDSVMAARWPVSLITTGATFICMVLILLMIGFGIDRRSILRGTKPEENNEMVDVEISDGRIVKTRSALSRWSFSNVSWENMTAVQRMLTFVRMLLILFSFAATIIMLTAEHLFDPNSMIMYILNGNWQYSLNIFALTKCLLLTIIVFSIQMAVHYMLMWCSSSMNARGVTSCRLFDNFFRLACLIYLLYVGLGLVGVDTKTLLASAGILSLVIGLGAQSLINDVIAGLFIVFEGEFQVGDIITLDDFRGTVLEIGVRTTKVKAPDGNIKIFANRSVTNVLNMTQDLSVVKCVVGIDYGDDLERIEDVLERELPVIGERIPEIKKGPYYKGVEALNSSSVDLKIIAYCSEADRVGTTAQLNREIKLIMDRNRIQIPFPQIVLNKRDEHEKHIDNEEE